MEMAIKSRKKKRKKPWRAQKGGGSQRLNEIYQLAESATSPICGRFPAFRHPRKTGAQVRNHETSHASESPSVSTNMIADNLGVIWICIASTLCGCNQTNGFMNNRSGMIAYQQRDYTTARRAFERAPCEDGPEYPRSLPASLAMRRP